MGEAGQERPARDPTGLAARAVGAPSLRRYRTKGDPADAFVSAEAVPLR